MSFAHIQTQEKSGNGTVILSHALFVLFASCKEDIFSLSSYLSRTDVIVWSICCFVLYGWNVNRSRIWFNHIIIVIFLVCFICFECNISLWGLITLEESFQIKWLSESNYMLGLGDSSNVYIHHISLSMKTTATHWQFLWIVI